jgi:hypothetical protein
VPASYAVATVLYLERSSIAIEFTPTWWRALTAIAWAQITTRSCRIAHARTSLSDIHSHVRQTEGVVSSHQSMRSSTVSPDRAPRCRNGRASEPFSRITLEETLSCDTSNTPTSDHESANASTSRHSCSSSERGALAVRRKELHSQKPPTLSARRDLPRRADRAQSTKTKSKKTTTQPPFADAAGDVVTSSSTRSSVGGNSRIAFRLA